MSAPRGVSVALTVACLVCGPVPAFASQDKPVPPELHRLVAEGGTRSSIHDGVLRVRKGSGWVRTRRIFGDVSMTAEIRLLSAKTELSIGIRTVNTRDEWPRRGYRFNISSTKPATLTASRYTVKEQQASSVVPTIGEWHVLTIAVKGPQLEASIDGQPAGKYAIDVPAGSILFQASGDDAELRSIAFDVPPTSGVLRGTDYRKSSDFVYPKLIKEVKPNYTVNAMAAKVQGKVWLEAVVLADGSMGGIWLTQLLHPELEHSALDAVRQWRFSPGQLNGAPVPVLIEIEMSFTLK